MNEKLDKELDEYMLTLNYHRAEAVKDHRTVIRYEYVVHGELQNISRALALSLMRREKRLQIKRDIEVMKTTMYSQPEETSARIAKLEAQIGGGNE